MHDPDGGRFTYAHDPASRLSGLENPWNERTMFNCDAAGRRTLKKLANGTEASFSYDAADPLTTLANMDSTAACFSRYDYKYDNADNRTAVLEADGSRVTWSYDAANQLLAENRTEGDGSCNPIVSRGGIAVDFGQMKRTRGRRPWADFYRSRRHNES